MKATKLQLGNLVLLGDKIIRVDAIHKRKVGYHIKFDKLNFVFEDQVNPIPITPEILERNFSKDPAWKGAYFINDCLHIYCEENENCWTIQYMEFIELSYVHELQNALTLLKFEKEIEL